MRKQKIDKLKDLVVRVKNRDEVAFTELYGQLYQKIYFLSLAIVKDEYLAQDVVQETFIAIYQKIDKLKNDDLFVAWVNRITYHCALRVLKSKEEIPVEGELIVKDIASMNGKDPIDIAILNEHKNIIMSHILELPVDYRSVLVLRYYNNMKLGEIAAIMDCSLGTIKSRLNRSKRMLKTQLMSGTKLFSAIGVCGMALSYSMKTYAAEQAISVGLANVLLESGKHQLGINLSTHLSGAASGTGLLWSQKALIACVGTAVIGGGLINMVPDSIEITGNDGLYTNHNVMLEVNVETVLSPKSVLIKDNNDQIYARLQKKGKDYKAVIGQNGSYYVEVTGKIGSVSKKEFEVTNIDKESPVLFGHSWNEDKNRFYGYLSDELSGIDYTKIYKKDKNGIRSKPVFYDETRGVVEFVLPREEFYIEIYDKVGNMVEYEVSLYYYEE